MKLKYSTEMDSTRKDIREEKKLTNVIPWAFIKGCGLDLLKKCVRPAMAIKQEPYFGSVTVYYNSHLKKAENNQNLLCELTVWYLSTPCLETYSSRAVPVSRGLQ